MNIIIHKGTEEIGGSCVEFSTENTTILVDYGEPLNKDSGEVDLSSLKVDGLLISHAHQDHYGFIEKLPASVPVYTSEVSFEFIRATRIFLNKELFKNEFKFFKSWESFTIKDFKITPYLMDHSATSAYAFLIEADGKRVFYSGDFRSHGRKAKLFDKLILQPPENLDLLLMEGTMLHRENEEFKNETDVENKILEKIKDSKGLSFLIASSQNIDRIVSAYRACKRAGRIFVIDIYTAWILEIMLKISNHVPNLSWDDIRVIAKGSLAGYYYNIIKDKELFRDFKSKLYKENNLIEVEKILSEPDKYFLKISYKYINGVANKTGLKSTVIYSQWLGYMEEKHSPEGCNTYLELKNSSNIDFTYAHTSGHAVMADLQNFAKSLKPSKLIPIHTEHPGDYEKYFDNVTLLKDGEALKV